MLICQFSTTLVYNRFNGVCYNSLLIEEFHLPCGYVHEELDTTGKTFHILLYFVSVHYVYFFCM